VKKRLPFYSVQVGLPLFSPENGLFASAEGETSPLGSKAARPAAGAGGNPLKTGKF